MGWNLSLEDSIHGGLERKVMTEEQKKVREKEVNEYLQKKKNKQELTEIAKMLFVLASIGITFIVAILIFIYRIKNPHLTETELFIYSVTKYWWAWLMLIISGFINANK